MKHKLKVFVVMIDDVDANADVSSVQECSVWSTKDKAIKHLKAVKMDYKETFSDYINNDSVGFSEETEKSYVLTESEEHFTFYEQGNQQNNHVEIWIIEKEVDEA